MPIINKPFRENNVCPVCKKQNFKRLYNISYFSNKVIELLKVNQSPEITLLQCSCCEHKFPDRYLDPSLLGNYYESISSEYYLSGNIQLTDPNFDKNASIYQRIYKLFPQGGKILEIGCGYGYLLNHFSDTKWTKFGVEPSPKAGAYAREKFNIQIKNELYKRALYNKNEFDLIICFDVVEHLVDIQQFLDDAFYHLKNNGKLIIGTGNAGSLNAQLGKGMWSYFSSYEHVQFFTIKSMKTALTRAKFSNLQIHRYSYAGSIFKNLFTFGRNGIKFLIFNLLKLKKRYSNHLCFDHMLVVSEKHYA